MSDKQRVKDRKTDGGAPASLCPLCVHKRSGPVCAAFPTGIPEAFLSGYALHTKAHPGDNGLRYERDPIFGTAPGLEDAAGPTGAKKAG